MALVERLRRVPSVGWAVLFAVALILPGIGSFGFWDPWELSLADRARDIASSPSLLDPTIGGRFAAEPPLDLFLSALGMKIFAASELGGRIFNALFGVGAIVAVYWAGVGLFRRRAALLAALVLGTMPLFLLQARQLTSDTPLVAGLALALGGLGRYAWPASGVRRLGHLAIAALGMAAGLFSGGALLGVALPCLAITGAVAAGWGLRARAAETETAAALTTAALGRDIHAGSTLGRGFLSPGARGKVVLLLIALLGVTVLVVTLTTANIAGHYSLWLGGIPRSGVPSTKFEYLIKQLGFGLFPWSALVVFALGRALVRLGGSDEEDGGRLAFGQLHLLIFASFGFALSSVFILMTGDARFPALAALALAAGAFLDEALEGERSEPVLGLLVATGTMIVARDFFLAPEELASVHLVSGNKVKWPPTLSVGVAFLAAGLIVGLGIYTGLATRGRALGRVAMRDLGEGPRVWRTRVERLVVEIGRWGVQAAVVGAIVFAGFLAHGIVPMLSRHLSFKPVFESYARFAREGEEIGRYKVEGHGSAFYSRGVLVDIPTQERLMEFLRQPKRAFSVVPTDELAALDAMFKLARLDYYVVDASSSRFLLLSNKIGSGEEDKNPLKRDVWMAPRPPEQVTAAAGQAPAPANVEGNDLAPSAAPTTRWEWHGQVPPWKWRIPASTVFADSIELVGADYPATVRRPGKIPLTLTFRVNARPPGGFKLFVHFDAPGEPRLIGDHPPLNGTFPTANWLPGEYIRDFYEVDVPLMTTPAGTYTLYLGFWPGGEGRRLKITAGPNDGGDRTRIGTIEIK